MAKRRFDLPGIQDLSKEQEAARALPKAGQYLIVGGPGTGKSVLALIRTRRHQRDGDDYLFLVYNHLLNRECESISSPQADFQISIRPDDGFDVRIGQDTARGGIMR